MVAGPLDNVDSTLVTVSGHRAPLLLMIASEVPCTGSLFRYTNSLFKHLLNYELDILSIGRTCGLENG